MIERAPKRVCQPQWRKKIIHTTFGSIRIPQQQHIQKKLSYIILQHVRRTIYQNGQSDPNSSTSKLGDI